MKRALLFTVVAILATSMSVSAQDPGIRDTVRFEVDSLILGRSCPVTISIFNDEEITTIDLAIELTEALGGFATYDSITYIGRMADPRVMDFRGVTTHTRDGTPPDTVGVYAVAYQRVHLLPGDGPVAQLWLSASGAGRLAINPGWYAPVVRNVFVALGVYSECSFIFKGDTADIIDGLPVPIISGPELERGTAGSSSIGFTVGSESPAGLAVSLQLVSFGNADDDSRQPEEAPSFDTNTGAFAWSPTTSDIGIWKAVFRSCDTLGGCAQQTTMIEIVADQGQLVDFSTQSVPSNTMALFLENYDFDGDLYPEVIVGGWGVFYTKLLTVFDQGSTGTWDPVYSFDNSFPHRGYELAYVDDDDYVDIVQSHYTGAAGDTLSVLFGGADFSFSAQAVGPTDVLPRGTAMINFNGDELLDYAVIGQGLLVLAGDESAGFVEACRRSDNGLCVNGADFNRDGYDDLAVTDATRLRIFLNNGGTGFTAAGDYPQEYAAADIDITNEGSDFNGDGYFDLCLSTPSVGGEYSRIVIYLGDGAGGFTQVPARIVRGQTLGNRIGDVNGDGNVDIVYANGATKRIGILFGDGLGGFPAEIRLPIPELSPYRVTLTDLDLDGDLDIVAGSYALNQGATLTFFENQINPNGLNQAALAVTAMNGTSVDLVSPAGKVLNSIANTMAAGRYVRRSLDGDSDLDAVATVNVVESGPYTLNVTPKPGALRSETFSLDYTLDGAHYRLAKDAPMPPDGYTFTVYPAGSSEVAPIPGAFIPSATPSFHWMTTGTFDFQLAYDPAFTNIVYTATVTGDGLTLPEPLAVADTTTLYWRFKSQAQGTWDNLYVVNLIPASASLCGDADGSSGVNIADLTYLVAFLFRGGPAPATVGLIDLDSSGQITVADLTRFVAFLFRGQGPLNCVQ